MKSSTVVPCLFPTKKSRPSLPVIAALVFSLPVSGWAQITSVLHYSDITEAQGDMTYSSMDAPLGVSSFFEGGFAEPLPKFNPALGILQQIRISIHIDWAATLELQADLISDDSLPHSAGFDSSLSFGLYYTPTPQSIITNVLERFPGMGISFTESSSTPGMFQNTFFENLQDNITLFDLANSVLLVNLDDFVGVGHVAGLRPGIFAPLTDSFSLDNVEVATAFLDTRLEGWIEIEYVYQIPEPAQVGTVLALGALFLVFRRRYRDR